jgi:hypothetical protein
MFSSLQAKSPAEIKAEKRRAEWEAQRQAELTEHVDAGLRMRKRSSGTGPAGQRADARRWPYEATIGHHAQAGCQGAGNTRAALTCNRGQSHVTGYFGIYRSSRSFSP